MTDLEEQVERYLQHKELNYVKRSISYIGEMKNEKLLDGKYKDVHLIRFRLSVDSDLENQICYIHADANTQRVEHLVTPHMFEKIYRGKNGFLSNLKGTKYAKWHEDHLHAGEFNSKKIKIINEP